MNNVGKTMNLCYCNVSVSVQLISLCWCIIARRTFVEMLFL